MIVLPGGGYAAHAPHEAEPVARWLGEIGVQASVFRYPLNVRYPVPLDALRAEIGRRRAAGAQRIGLIGFSAGGHLAGLAALAPGAAPEQTVQFAVLGYAITSMETETYRPARLILREPRYPGTPGVATSDMSARQQSHLPQPPADSCPKPAIAAIRAPSQAVSVCRPAFGPLPRCLRVMPRCRRLRRRARQLHSWTWVMPGRRPEGRSRRAGLAAPARWWNRGRQHGRTVRRRCGPGRGPRC